MENLLKGAMENKGNKHQSHGLSVAEMKEVHEKQKLGGTDKIPANCKSEYEIDKHEAHLVHVLVDEDRWDKGKKLSTPYVKKFYLDDFLKMSQTEATKRPDGGKTFPENAFAAWKTEIIHDPRKTATSAKTKTIPAAPKTETPLEDLSIEDLKLKYKEVTGNDAQEEDTAPQLISILKEELGKKARPAIPPKPATKK